MPLKAVLYIVPWVNHCKQKSLISIQSSEHVPSTFVHQVAGVQSLAEVEGRHRTVEVLHRDLLLPVGEAGGQLELLVRVRAGEPGDHALAEHVPSGSGGEHRGPEHKIVYRYLQFNFNSIIFFIIIIIIKIMKDVQN